MQMPLHNGSHRAEDAPYHKVAQEENAGRNKGAFLFAAR